MHRAVCLLVLAMVVFLAPAMANLVPVNGIFSGNSWGQRFVGDVGSYNVLEIEYVTGSTFEVPAFRNFSSSGWGVGGTATLSWANSGSVLNNVQFDILFNDPQVNPTAFKFWALNGTQVVDSALATWNGGWQFSALGDAPPSVAGVPDGGVTVMLLGGALLGLETLRRRLRA